VKARLKIMQAGQGRSRVQNIPGLVVKQIRPLSIALSSVDTITLTAIDAHLSAPDAISVWQIEPTGCGGPSIDGSVSEIFARTYH